MSDNNKNRTVKIRTLLIIAVIVVMVILSAVNISVRTYKVSVTPSTQMQSDLSNFVTTNTSPHYNFKIGYINFSAGNSEISFGYFLRPFNGWNPVYAGPVNFSLGDAPSNLVMIVIYQIASSVSANPSSVPFILNNVTLISPQGFNGKIEIWNSVDSNSLVIGINPPDPSFIQSFPASSVLGSYPGYHNFYLNFTLTIYNTFGPYKFPSQSQTVHLDYNNTVVV